MLVTLKTLPPELGRDERMARLFARGMHVAAELEHPNIASIVEVGQAGGQLWVASEYVDGVDAAELTRRAGGRLGLGDAVDIVAQALDALQYGHDRSLVHRDVKPQNILVVGQAGAYRAKLTDFGLMKNMDEAGMTGITREGEVRGTAVFMPPEQVLDCRFVKPEGDLYQAGASLYWMLSGRFPHDFEATDRRGERKDPFVVILEDPITPLAAAAPSVPQAVAAVVDRALEPEPDDRFVSAAEMARALRGAV